MNHRFDSRLEAQYRRTLVGHRSNVLHEIRPGAEIIAARYRELGVIEVEHRGANLGVRQLLRQPRDGDIEKARVLVPDNLDRARIAVPPGVEQGGGLVTVLLQRGAIGQG